MLRTQALSSLHSKAYHVAGAAILATFLPPGQRQRYVEIVAPLETIYDYLDCLCDRHPHTPPEAHPQLHEALSDALDPGGTFHDYYELGPQGDDGGYLRSLVEQVRTALSRLPGYDRFVPLARTAASLYASAQTVKHLQADERERACVAWYEREGAAYRDLSWWEFCAAAGSQFHIYAPIYALFNNPDAKLAPVYDAYFPAMCALHVLLDAFIDQQEDRAHNELSWIECYPSKEAFFERARELAAGARARFARLPTPRAHCFALRIMALFYLTHPKIEQQQLNSDALTLLDAIS